MEEILNRIHYRETAAAKRERTMAYAFSHQASTTQIFLFILNQEFFQFVKSWIGFAVEGEFQSVFWAVLL